ncbi:virulence RhuM family protein [Mannheimia sp. AT1]|uniref:Virulence RhuM family protein n=1 Tax=Mannheimia cairinae TaxID=3025936 RepID=A0ABT5MQF2_9PAST|nr:virulence RhuM family protein [Mannheimia cairinae]MDD0824416.1 virulence RhuM family protein [Mannheimia cairinae]MDD0825517.1 virulence RhuM family protein [Mannheimia cairinae]
MSDLTTPTSANILFYSANQNVKIEVQYLDETFWLTQKNMAELFGVEVPAISKHLDNIYQTGELVQNATISKMEIVRQEGKRMVKRKVDFYNLDAIIAVGYRVNSREATQFRIWATNTLREFIIKGFVIDDLRLKQGKQFEQDYFEQLVEKIREIRASERRFYEKITDLYALSSDYDAKSPITKQFFATVQNKLHWAITGQTAAELIYHKADSQLPNMGLTNWRNAPDGKILKSDVSVAKNYLQEAHISELNQLVSAYLDLAENRARRQILMNMAEWETFLNNFLTLSNYPILQDKGKISAEMAKIKAESEYEKFRVVQDRTFKSDFNKFLEEFSQIDTSNK